MFRDFFLFELRYFLRGWMVWIFLIIIGAMIFGAASSDNVTVGGGIGNTHRNSPFVIENFFAVTSILTLLMTTAFVNNAGLRDYQHNTNQMIFSLPISRRGFLWGRFLGATIVAVIPALGVSLGTALAKFAPWADSERFGPFYLHPHINGLLAFSIPNTFFVAAILFIIAVRFRSTTISFLSALLLLVALGVADSYSEDFKNEKLAALLEPFGSRAFTVATKYWTVAERNTLSLAPVGLLLWNRLIWMAVGLGIFVFFSERLTLGERSSRKTKKIHEESVAAAPATAALPEIKPSWKGQAALSQFLGSFRFELKSLIKTPTFIVILAAALLNCIASMALSTPEGFGNKTFPVTYWTSQVIQGTLYMFLVAIITFFAGQLVWRDRDERVDEVQDSLPMKDWLLYSSKLAALLVSVFLILVVAVMAGVIVQAAKGYTRFQPELYAQQILWRDYSLMVFLAVAGFFFHVVSPNKYIGYFSFIAFLIADAFAWRGLDIATRMVNYGSRPSVTYSDLFHFAPDSPGFFWFTVYWSLFCLIVAVASILLYRRGKETAWSHRIRVAAQRLHGGLKVASIVTVTLFALTAGWIFYNTKILNKIVSPDEAKLRSAEYEKKYKQYQKIAQPRVLAVRYEIDIFPEKRGVEMRGVETIRNRTSEPVSDIHFTINNDHDTKIEIDGAKLTQDDKRLYYRIYRLATPMQPGEERAIHFTVKGEQKGFANSVERTEFVQNGTFFNNMIAPQIGYRDDVELSDRNDRRKHGLKEKDLMPALERNCTADCMNTYLSANSDWVSVETIVSTSADQMAVAPGTLVKEWTSNGRRYYKYKLDQDSMNFYSFISARYEVAREQWNGINLEVYYHPEHKWNVPRMMTSIRKSLEYYTTNFGSYRHKQARIIEFPRVARFAQAFPGTMPYSEGIGFIADLRDPEDIDHVFYIVAHEMGHQWWAHQVIGAEMQGATLLSETLAQYSALMVMEKEYGRDMMRKFLEYEMDRYLRSRGTERIKERPLMRVESSQGYIHYNKGSVVLYYLKEMIGEQAVNQALREVVVKFAYAPPPYPTSYELVDRLREKTPPQYRYLIKDLFEEITLFSNRTLEASATRLPGGKYEVTVRAEAKKFKADERGEETEIPIADVLEFGAFAKPEKGKKFGKTLFRERLLVDKPQVTRTFVVAELPDKAGIDPFHLVVDRTPDDNTKTVEMVPVQLEMEKAFPH